MPTNLRKPLLFQGNLKQSNYFEGWYYKQVSQDQKTSLSLIPGISLNTTDEHSFIQYILVQADDAGQTSTLTGYIRYPLASFNFQNNPFEVQIGNSVFREDNIAVDLKDEHIEINGQLILGSFLPIESSLLMPNIMGIFAYTPKMECYHGVISMNHSLKGLLTINQETIQFKDISKRIGGPHFLSAIFGCKVIILITRKPVSFSRLLIFPFILLNLKALFVIWSITESNIVLRHTI